MVRHWTLVFFAIFLIDSEESAASVAVEPYLGYSRFEWSSGGYSDSKMGTVLGGKGGLQLNSGTFVALDFHLGGPYLLDSSNSDNEFLNRMWGVGVRFGKSKTHLWLGYYSLNELTDINANLKYLGRAIKATLGIESQSKLSLNFEFVKQEFNQIEGGQISAENFNLDVTLLILSISAPLELK